MATCQDPKTQDAGGRGRCAHCQVAQLAAVATRTSKTTRHPLGLVVNVTVTVTVTVIVTSLPLQRDLPLLRDWHPPRCAEKVVGPLRDGEVALQQLCMRERAHDRVSRLHGCMHAM